MNKNTRLKLVTENSASITIPNTKYPSPHHHNLPSFSFHKSSCNFSTISNTHYDAAIIYSSFHKSTLLQVSQYHTHLHTHTHTTYASFLFHKSTQIVVKSCSLLQFPSRRSRRRSEQQRKDPHGRRLNPSLRAIFCISPYLPRTLMDRCGWFYAYTKGLFSVGFSPLPALLASPSSHKFRSFMCLSVAFAEVVEMRPVSMIKFSLSFRTCTRCIGYFRV